MARLSVNINKIAILRNARGKNRPDLLEFARTLIALGVSSLTVHPRPDERHITRCDVYALAELLAKYTSAVEFNIEGYPSPTFLSLIKEISPRQCTLVPDPPDAITSNAGWQVLEHEALLTSVRQEIAKTTRFSLFINPFDYQQNSGEAVAAIRRIGVERIELYTEAYADAFLSPQREAVTGVYKNFSLHCHDYGIGINAGHDLNGENLAYLIAQIPVIAEVSIGHALISDCLYGGVASTIARYQEALTPRA